MNQAIPLDKHLRAKESADRLHIYTTGALPKDIRDDMKILVNFVKSISSLPSDTQWIDKLEKELEEEDKDIDSLDDYYMGLSVGKSSMLNRVKKEILSNNN